MIDFEIMERSLKIASIKRIAESSNASWKNFPNQALNQYGGLKFLIECDYDPNLLNLENLPEFYHTILNYCVHQRGNSVHLHAPFQNLERTKTDHVPSQNYSQYFTYPI